MARRLIKRKSAVKVSKLEGNIVDTTNIKDKKKNTYSANVIEKLIEDNVPDVEVPTKTSQLINDSGFITGLKISSITTSSHTIANNQYFSPQQVYETNVTYTKEGYYPVSVWGYCSGVSLQQLYISSGGLGTATLHFKMYNTSSGTAYTGTLIAYITWIK